MTLKFFRRKMGKALPLLMLITAASVGCASDTPIDTSTPSADVPSETASPTRSATASPTHPISQTPSVQQTPTASPETETETATATSTQTPATPTPLQATATPDELARLCEDAPVLTWDNFGKGFTIESCQSCHASTAVNRYGAPEGVTFDTLEQTLVWKARVLARATGATADMPPGGGVSDDDRYRLEVWLRCWET